MISFDLEGEQKKKNQNIFKPGEVRGGGGPPVRRKKRKGA